MAEEQIQIAVEFDGADQAVRALGDVSQGVERVGSTADTSTRSFASFSQGAQNTVQRIQGMAGAVQSLVSALGSRDRTAGLVASVAGATAQFAAMGSMLGPGGAVVGGLAGLVAGLVGVVDATNNAGTAVERAAEAMRNATTDADRYAAALTLVRTETEALARMGRRRAISAGDPLVNMTEDEGRAEIYAMEAEIAQLVDRYGDAAENGARVEALRANIDRVRREVLGESAGGIEVEEGTVTIVNPGRAPSRSGAAASEDPVTVVDFNERYREESARIMTARLAEVAQVNEDELTLELERWEATDARARESEELRRRLMEERLEETRRINEEELEAEIEREERLAAKRRDIQEQSDAKLQDMTDRRQAQRESEYQEATGLLGDTTMMFGKTLATIALGEQSAEEAFKGLAKSFLEMISQYTTLKAATEFAEAGASFARYDYGGGAAHIAAGVAFTAVAVATGVGAAAIGQAPAAPARPETGGADAMGSRGGDTIINWNSPVVMAGTYAEVGRELRVAIDAAGSI